MRYPATLSLFVFAVFLLLSACKKEKEDGNVFTSKTWKRGEVDRDSTSNPDGRILYYDVSDCQNDDEFRFDAAGKLRINRGVKICTSDQQRYELMNYDYDAETKQLTMGGFTYTVAQVSGDQIKYYARLNFNATGYNYLVFLLQ